MLYKHSKILGVYDKLADVPFGLSIMSFAICLRSPYFFSIRPKIISLERGRMKAFICQRRGVQNHIGSIHALALGNLVEFVAGVMMEASIPRTGVRWIPKGISMEYHKVAKGQVMAEAVIEIPESWEGKFDIVVKVTLTDTANHRVVSASVPMYISPTNSAKP